MKYLEVHFNLGSCGPFAIIGDRLSSGNLRQTEMHPCPTYVSDEKEVIQLLFLLHERGQGLVEYALILVLVAMVVIIVLAFLGPEIGNVFSNIVGSI